jgi:hypothetical protein
MWIPMALAALLPAYALNVTGRVLTKLGAPIPGAQVCIKSNPGSCVTTGAQGEFSLSGAIAIRPAVHAGSRFSLSRQGGSLRVESNSAVSVRLEWLSADGRTRWAVSDQRLAAGSNPLALPSGLPHAGLCILRLSGSTETLAWKVVLASGPAVSPGAASSAAPRIAALSKAASALLEISKTGFRPRIYQPRSDTDTSALIHLSEIADTGFAYSGTQHTTIASIDRIRHLIITVDSGFYCDWQTDSLVVTQTFDTAHYAIRDGRLWLWETPDCEGTLFTGTSSDPVGRWDLIEPSAPLPADLMVGCSQNSGGSVGGVFESLREEITLAETGITTSVSFGMCPGDFYATNLASNLFWDSSVVITKSSCQQITFRNQAGNTGTIDFSKREDSLSVAFASPGKTCQTGIKFNLNDRTHTCPEGPSSDGSDFLTCISDAGFGQIYLVKTAAQPMSRERPATWLSALRTGADERDPLRRREYISGAWKPTSPNR